MPHIKCNSVTRRPSPRMLDLILTFSVLTLAVSFQSWSITSSSLKINPNSISADLSDGKFLLKRNFFLPRMISSGFTFDDGEQRLISLQKPLGLILEERDNGKGCEVVEVIISDETSAHRAGIKVGDILLSVQNADVSQAHLEEVMQRIQQSPRAVNLRFLVVDKKM